MSSIMKGLSRVSSSRSLWIDNSVSYNSGYNLDNAYTLASSSYGSNKFTKLNNNSSMIDRSTSTKDS